MSVLTSRTMGKPKGDNIVVTIIGEGRTDGLRPSCVTINGVKYTSGVVEVEAGTIISVTVDGNESSGCYVKAFGTKVLSTAGTYDYNTADYPDTNITIAIAYSNMSSVYDTTCYVASIVETGIYNDITVTVAGSGDSSYGYVIFNGVKYTKPASFTCPGDSVIGVYTGGSYDSGEMEHWRFGHAWNAFDAEVPYRATWYPDINITITLSTYDTDDGVYCHARITETA